MQINLSWDPSVQALSGSLKASVEGAVTYAADYFASLLDVPYAVTIQVGWNEITQNGVSTPITQAGEALGGPNAILNYTYNQVASALNANVNSAATRSAVAHLVGSGQTPGGGVDLTIEQAEALGLPLQGFSSSDATGSIGFGASSSYDFSTSDRAIQNEYDFVGVAEHEIAHALGRISNVGSADLDLLDLFRFTASNTLASNPFQSAYFSIDGGLTRQKNFDDTNSDPSDWSINSTGDSFDAVGDFGTEDVVSAVDVNVMNLLGYRIRPTASDFTGQRMSDILFRNNSSGEAFLYEMNDKTVTASAPTSTQVDDNWQIVGVGDFNGDGDTDLLWSYENASNTTDPLNGVSYLTTQNGFAATAQSAVVQQLSSDWQAQGVGDFDGDGKSDVLYRNATSGALYLDFMNGAQIEAKSGFTSQQVTDPNWRVAAIADFTGDDKADILWRYDNASNAADTLNGDLFLWTMNGNTVTSATALNQEPGSANWQVAGAGDFDGDGKADILFRYENSNNAADPLNGLTYVDFMNGATVTSGAPTQFQVDNSWTIAGLGDFNGDEQSDILWQQTGSGNTYLWDMNGAHVASSGFTSQLSGPGWSVQNGKLMAG